MEMKFIEIQMQVSLYVLVIGYWLLGAVNFVSHFGAFLDCT